MKAPPTASETMPEMFWLMALIKVLKASVKAVTRLLIREPRSITGVDI